MIGLGDLPGGQFSSGATGVSADGSVVVGMGSSAFALDHEAFRWTAEGGMVGLGDLPGGDFYSLARAVSGDGSVVVGYSKSALGQEAFIWDATNGMRSLLDVLTNDYGLDLTGWTLMDASAISPNGFSIVGSGYNPQGFREAWLVQFDEAVVPIPGAVLLGVLGLGTATWRLRRMRA